jgi:hypothetical protein
MKIKLNIQSYQDRNNTVIALANAGIKVYIEKETVLARDTYYVIFDWYINTTDNTEEKCDYNIAKHLDILDVHLIIKALGHLHNTTHPSTYDSDKAILPLMEKLTKWVVA